MQTIKHIIKNHFFEHYQAGFEKIKKATLFSLLKQEIKNNEPLKQEVFATIINKVQQNLKQTPKNLRKKFFYLMRTLNFKENQNNITKYNFFKTLQIKQNLKLKNFWNCFKSINYFFFHHYKDFNI